MNIENIKAAVKAAEDTFFTEDQAAQLMMAIDIMVEVVRKMDTVELSSVLGMVVDTWAAINGVPKEEHLGIFQRLAEVQARVYESEGPVRL